MKIHTTQDLNTLVQKKNQQTTNSVSKEFRLKNYSEQMLMPKLSAELAESYGSSVTFGSLFGKKKPSVADAKKIINNAKKMVGDVAKNANPEKKGRDKFLTGSFFNSLLSISKYETGVQAAIAAVICTVLRPVTIMAMPTQKSKDDNRYASAHSIASGLVGLVTTIALTTPFKWGADYVKKNMLKNLDEKALKRLFPQLKIESITDKSGNRVDVKEWLNKDLKPFCQELKDVMKLPKFKQFAEVSEQTFENILKVKNVDWAAQKGKSFNDITLKNGKKLYDELDWSRIGIVVKEDGINDAQILLRDLNKDYLEKLIKDAPGDSNWSKLDINSVYKDKAGTEVVDFRNWKDTKGKQWKFDLDTAYVSSPYETNAYKPRITGKKRYDEKDKEYKFTTYQKNGGEDGSLGTEITDEMVLSEARNEGHQKLLTWLPDLAFRVPIAATTIALIPFVLKKVFGVEKSKKKTPENKIINKQDVQPTINQAQTEKVAFKGGKNNAAKKGGWFVRKFGEWYGKPLLENETVAKISEKLSKIPGGMTELMTVIGSFITSSVYVQRTMTNKDLDPDRRRTLAINQTLCFFVPTAAAYTVNNALKNVTKKIEYSYSDLQEQKMDIAKIEKKVIDDKKIKEELGNKLKGVRILSGLATFTLIYRYATPVIITPIANWIGDKINTKKAAEKTTAKEIALKPNDVKTDIEKQGDAKEIALNNNNKENRQVA